MTKRQKFRALSIGVFGDEMAAFKLTMCTALRGYHMYKAIWAPTHTVGEEFNCGQNLAMRRTGTL